MTSKVKYKWEQIKADLLEKISSGTLKQGMMLPSEQKLQETYGVSRVCLRQTLGSLLADGAITRISGKGTFIGKATDIPPKYRKKSRLIALTILGTVNERPHLAMLEGINAAISPNGYHTVVETIPDDPGLEQKAINALMAKNIDAFILTPTSRLKKGGGTANSEGFYRTLKQKKVPFVIADRFFPDERWSCVSYQVNEPTLEIVSEFAQTGKKRIAYLGIGFSMEGERRYKAYLKAMEHKKLNVNTGTTILCAGNDGHFDSVIWGHYAANKLIRSGEKFDAIVTFSDMVAWGAFQELQSSNISLNGKFIAGLENIYVPDKAFQKSLITSATKPSYEIGEYAGKLIMEELESDCECPKITKLLPMPMINDSISRDMQENKYASFAII